MVTAGFVVTAAMFLAVGGHPSERPPSPPVRLGPVLFPGEESRTPSSEARLGRVRVECGRFEGEEKHKSCNNHCRLLREEYKGGECIEGKCHCKEEAEKITCEDSCSTRCKSLGREDRCVDGVCHCHDVEIECEKHESCTSHCLTLGHTDSRCHEGVCKCGELKNGDVKSTTEESVAAEKRPTVKCVELVPVGEKLKNQGELCSKHCRSLKEGYRGGECDKGICYCSN